MKIDQYNKTLTIECYTDFYVVYNYLNTCLTKEEAKEWTVITKDDVCLKTTK